MPERRHLPVSFYVPLSKRTRHIDPLMMSYRQKADWAIAFACNLMRGGLGDPRWTPQEVLLPQLADETPAERRTRAQIMGDNIR